MRASPLLPAAGLIGAVGVAGAAYAAHGGDPRLVGTAAAICLVHAPALLAVGLSGPHSRALGLAAAAWVLGVLLFSGDLLVRALLAPPEMIATAPFGGSLLILGWLCAGFAGFRLGRRR